MIYLDYNATTPVADPVMQAMLPYFTQKFGNAASHTHAYGWVAEAAVQKAREQIASLIGATAQEIVFTSGATEAVNLALKGLWESSQKSESGFVRNEIITVKTEHKAVLDTCKYLELRGAKVTLLSVNKDGQMDLEELKEKVSERTLLVSVMIANNETGVLQNIEEIAEIVHSAGAIYMSDATQAVGKIPVKVTAIKGGVGRGIDIMAFSSHKMYGPKGVGALYIRRRDPSVHLLPMIHGGGHERGLRSGTLNVPGIVGFGKASELAAQEMNERTITLSQYRDQLEAGILKLGRVLVNGAIKHRLPHVANLKVEGVKADKLMAALPGLAFSSGSACTSADPAPSHVLTAMGLSKEEAQSSIRLSLGRNTNKGEIDQAITELSQKIISLRNS